MAKQSSFWQRMGHMFGSEDSDAPPPDARREASAVATDEAPSGAASGSLELVAGDAAVPWWRRRQARQAQTREMSFRMLELAGALQQHFRQQDQHAVELAGSLDQLGGILEQLADAQRSQGECLRSIAENTKAADQRAAALTETLGRVPDSLVSQAEAIRTVARQLEVSQESDTQLMHSLQHFGQAVDTLGSSGTAQVEVLQQLNAAQREQHDSLTMLVRQQGRRFVLVVILAGILAIASLAALIVGVLLKTPVA